MIKRMQISMALFCGIMAAILLRMPCAIAAASPHGVVIQFVSVDDKPQTVHSGQLVNLGSSPSITTFGFGPNTNISDMPPRIRCRLEGYEDKWNDGIGDMNITIRFNNDKGELIGTRTFSVKGDSAGWDGSLKNSPLTHRRETLTVPPLAARLWVVMTSAGPPSTVGIYVMANLLVSRSPDNSSPKILMQSPLDRQVNEADSGQPQPAGWERDGLRASMAKIVEFGEDPPTKAFAILDDDANGHAEWHNMHGFAPRVNPGEHLLIEWNEMYSMGVGTFRTVNYPHLPPGEYKFHVIGTDIMGNPTGAEAVLAVFVPQPFWRQYWFWSVVVVSIAAAMIGGGRYLGWQKMRREMVRLKNQQTLERERLRIAHDIHDDLGARVTQISLLSAMSHDDISLPEKARADFDRISQMSRELVSALYETVWAVNPENDNMDALGNYVCQMVNTLCERTQFRCRFYVKDLPREIQVTSQTRHNISMAVKEAVHNVIKHAKASEVTIRMDYDGNLLTVSIHDDGCGFKPVQNLAGHGLTNMKKRLEDIGGTCTIDSEPGAGTTVHMRLQIKPIN